MHEQAEEGLAFDIGVDAETGPPPLSARSRRESDRSLPVWAVAIVALLAGWLLGSLIGGGGNETSGETPTPSTATSLTVTPPTLAPSLGPDPTAVASPPGTPLDRPLELPPTTAGASIFPSVRPPSSTDETIDEPADPATLVLVNAPLRGVAAPADLRVTQGGVETRIELDRQVSAANDRTTGQGEQQLLVVDDVVAFMALDLVMVFDPFEQSEPVRVAKASHLLAGSSPGRVWAVTADAESVIDIDVRNRRAHATYPLDGIGSPLASFDGGLVVAPTDSTLGPVALWNPSRGIESIPSIYDDADFIGATADTLVFFRGEGLATYNVVTGWNWQTALGLTSSIARWSLVSPDARSLAVAAQSTVTEPPLVQSTVSELPLVRVIDIETGEQLDSFTAAFARQLRWVSETELVFLASRVDGAQIMLRDTAANSTRKLAEVESPNFWVVVAN